jgi:hypothetical protein
MSGERPRRTPEKRSPKETFGGLFRSTSIAAQMIDRFEIACSNDGLSVRRGGRIGTGAGQNPMRSFGARGFRQTGFSMCPIRSGGWRERESGDVSPPRSAETT